MASRFPPFLLEAAVGAAFFIVEHGSRTHIVAPDQPDRSTAFAGTPNGSNGSRELGMRIIHSDRNPLF
jgi:hypothetical protein